MVDEILVNCTNTEKFMTELSERRKMKTTFGEIKKFKPCVDGWEKLCKKLNPEMDMLKEVSILQILESNGVKDAFWALRTQEYRDYCLILADVAESVLHIFEKKHPSDNRPRKAIEAIRSWYAGVMSDDELKNAFFAAATASAAATAAASAAAAAAASAAYAAAAAAYAAYTAAYYAVSAAQWKKNEEILRKYLEI